MLVEALAASLLVALVSLAGAIFFGNTSVVAKYEKWLIPVAVGVFLSLVLYELIPETLVTAPEYGGLAVAFGFITFYLLSSTLHNYFHKKADEVDCDKKSAANLILIGDAIHNLADGVILGGAFLVDPAVGVAVAIGLALHEIPQEIVEFGVLMRAGYTRTQAALRNLLSASSIIVGTFAILLIAEHATDYVWILTGVAAGNLLYLAASDLLPRIHEAGKVRSVGPAAVAIIIGFAVMSGVITWTHGEFGHGHKHHDEEHHDHDHADEAHHEDEHHDEALPHEEVITQ